MTTKKINKLRTHNDNGVYVEPVKGNSHKTTAIELLLTLVWGGIIYLTIGLIGSLASTPIKFEIKILASLIFMGLMIFYRALDNYKD